MIFGLKELPMIDIINSFGADKKKRLYRIARPYHIVELVCQQELWDEKKIDFLSPLQEIVMEINEQFNIEINGFSKQKIENEHIHSFIYPPSSPEKLNPIIVTTRHHFILFHIKGKIPKAETEKLLQEINGPNFPSSSGEINPNFLDQHFPFGDDEGEE